MSTSGSYSCQAVAELYDSSMMSICPYKTTN
jgi:hypothetical protein